MKELKKVNVVWLLVLHACMMVLFNVDALSMAGFCLLVGGVFVMDLLLSVFQFSGTYSSRVCFGKNFLLYILEKAGILFFDIMMYQNCSSEGKTGRMELLGDMSTFQVFCVSVGMTMAAAAFCVFMLGLLRTKREA